MRYWMSWNRRGKFEAACSATDDGGYAQETYQHLQQPETERLALVCFFSVSSALTFLVRISRNGKDTQKYWNYQMVQTSSSQAFQEL